MENEFSIRDDVVLPADDSRAMVIVNLGGTTWSFESRYVKEVFGLTPIVAVPRTPPFVLGVFQLRQSVEMVVDVAPLLGLPTRDQGAARLILAEVGPCRTAVAVDRVLEVTEIPLRMFRRREAPLAERYVEEELEYKKHYVPVLVLPRLLSDLLGAELVGGQW